jgi:anhydro-N-acetylmuramic acid kinase
MAELYVGLMSGTSLDAVDAVLVDLSTTPQLLATHTETISPTLKQELLALCQPGPDELQRYGELDVQMGELFATSCNTLLQNCQIPASKIRAIGSHGQTVRHKPNAPHPFSLQIGDPNIIALRTGITTVADFRRKDIAAGGQGAPLVPAFHQAVFQTEKEDRVIVNIGGIANVSYLPADKNLPVIGFDTGPGNLLLDHWIQKELAQAYDKEGLWAASGQVQPTLLARLLEDPYFSKTLPKSTGREYFNLAWLNNTLNETIKPADVQATLTELTAESISQAIQQHTPLAQALFVCGGGAKNQHLMNRLAHLNPNRRVSSTEELGIAPQWVEAMAFAWLAQQTLAGRSGNLRSVTGARKNAILGGIYCC